MLSPWFPIPVWFQAPDDPQYFVCGAAHVDSYNFKFVCRNETISIFIKNPERLEQLILIISLVSVVDHHLQEFWEVNRTISCNQID